MSNSAHLEKTLLETLGEAVIVTDRDWRIVIWNRAAEALYGWKAEEVLNNPVSQYLFTHLTQPNERD
ncbi:PAS domain-containing protein [Anaerolinea sp.]|uniref:PAS domain-containing protein n=1 Tax=Anaerolinea sp. TaxID=1872519 RepID=UPI002ACD2564|nr:PAS domain-containing protein [Anaerolinea sp.]